MKNIKQTMFSLAFVVIALGLYGLILTSSGKVLIWSEYLSIVLCFLFALISFQKPLIIAALAMTLGADYCLVLCNPMQQLWGMVFFLAAQMFYGIYLHRQGVHKALLFVRIGLSLAAMGVAILVLGEKADALALVSMCYYVNLIMNLLCAFARFRDHRLMALGFVLFLLCDTVIGLQVAAGGYLPIQEGSLIHRIIFPGFHLSWLFYLPSQVLIALSSRRT